MRYTKVAADAFGELQLNAGLLLTAFTPATGTVNDSDIFAATSGGTTFTSGPSYTDFGDGIDNIPANTKQLKRLDHYEARMKGTAKTVNTSTVEILLGASDSSTADGVTEIDPLADLSAEDFNDIWWVGDYSDKNGASNGGFLAIRLIDALNTGGFALKSNDKGKGDFDFDFLAHYDIDNLDKVPFEIYMRAGTAEPASNSSTGGSTGGTTGGN